MNGKLFIQGGDPWIEHRYIDILGKFIALWISFFILFQFIEYALLILFISSCREFTFERYKIAFIVPQIDKNLAK